ncbi:MAG: helix-turn-helix domain-containing protein [Eggerthellaceae bacterium]|nr:helix-turn-helix domain-containing protein [Eggerthellaceae bacterium]
MLSVKEAAEKLGVSGARIRALLKSGQLEGRKIGNAWAISEQSVAKRKQANAHPGRPAADPPRQYMRAIPDVEAAHRIYDEAAEVLVGCYNAAFLDQARTPQEQAFWIRVADFFLQQEQRKLVDEGVY